MSALSSSPSAALTSAEMQPGRCQLPCCPCAALPRPAAQAEAELRDLLFLTSLPILPLSLHLGWSGVFCPLPHLYPGSGPKAGPPSLSILSFQGTTSRPWPHSWGFKTCWVEEWVEGGPAMVFVLGFLPSLGLEPPLCASWASVPAFPP